MLCFYSFSVFFPFFFFPFPFPQRPPSLISCHRPPHIISSLLPSSPPSWIRIFIHENTYPIDQCPHRRAIDEAPLYSGVSLCFFLSLFPTPIEIGCHQQRSLTLLHHPRTELTPNSFQSSFNLLPHLLFHLRSLSPSSST